MKKAVEQTIAVRPAKREDARGIARVHVTTWRDAYPALLPNTYLVRRLSVPRATAEWERSLAQPPQREITSVAVRRGAIVVGYASGGPARDRAHGCEGELYAIYVHPDYQGLGLGRRLQEAVARHLLQQGMRSMMVEVLDGNPSRFFYEAMGARMIALQSNRFAGCNLPTLVYAWSDIRALAGAI